SGGPDQQAVAVGLVERSAVTIPAARQPQAAVEVLELAAEQDSNARLPKTVAGQLLPAASECFGHADGNGEVAPFPGFLPVHDLLGAGWRVAVNVIEAVEAPSVQDFAAKMITVRIGHGFAARETFGNACDFGVRTFPHVAEGIVQDSFDRCRVKQVPRTNIASSL